MFFYIKIFEFICLLGGFALKHTSTAPQKGAVDWRGVLGDASPKKKNKKIRKLFAKLLKYVKIRCLDEKLMNKENNIKGDKK